MFHKTGGNMQGATSLKPEYTLEGYVQRVLKEEAPKKKLTFDEWFLNEKWEVEYPYTVRDYLKMAWQAAQRNV